MEVNLMQKIKAMAAMLFLFAGMTSAAFAQSDNHTVTVEIQAINQVAITGDVALTISTATAGQAPDDATGQTTYAFTSNDTGGATRITASTNVDPTSLGSGGAGITLSVAAAAPGTGNSLGTVALNTGAVDVVNNINAVSASGLTLDYTLSATAAAGQLASTALTVTYTIVN
jgi:hypothetical protein